MREHETLRALPVELKCVVSEKINQHIIPTFARSDAFAVGAIEALGVACAEMMREQIGRRRTFRR